MATALLPAPPAPVAAGRRSRMPSPVVLLTSVGVINAVLFLIINPSVGDLWAARARQSAARHGVGLGYWFSWFAGSTPGNYSVLSPFLSGLLGAGILGALGTGAITPLAALLVRGSAHPVAATATAAFVAGLSLWSGRVPFAVGTAVSIVAFIAVRAERRTLACALAVLTALVSPVSAFFFAMGVAALFITNPRFRVISAMAASATVVSLAGIALIFGTPGTEPFSLLKAGTVAAALALMLVARPAPYVRVVIFIAIAACPMLVLVPNGMGSNFQRLVWFCLPIAVATTATARLRVALAACALPIVLSAQATVSDLWVSAQPMSSEHYYDNLAAELDRTPGLANYRVEVVPDGTHNSAYALLNHAMLARGYETQEDSVQNAVVMSSHLNAISYKLWLDNNAVGYVAIGGTTIATNPEDTLIRQHLPKYLTKVWSDQHWLLYRVQYPSPVISSPATVIAADQASMELNVPRAGSYTIRVHWSRFLKISPTVPKTTTMSDDGFGFTKLTVTA